MANVQIKISTMIGYILTNLSKKPEKAKIFSIPSLFKFSIQEEHIRYQNKSFVRTSPTLKYQIFHGFEFQLHEQSTFYLSVARPSNLSVPSKIENSIFN